MLDARLVVVYSIETIFFLGPSTTTPVSICKGDQNAQIQSIASVSYAAKLYLKIHPIL